MLDIKFIKENPELVKENIKKKFKEDKLPLVDQVIELYDAKLAALQRGEELRANRNKLSKQIGMLMGQGKREEAEEVNKQVAAQAQELKELEEKEAASSEELKQKLMKIPQIIDPSVPIGKNDEENVEVECFGEKTSVDFEIHYHTYIMA